MGVDDFCNTGLVLGLGLSSSTKIIPRNIIIDDNQKPKTHLINHDQQQLAKGSLNFEPSLTLSLHGEAFDTNHKFENSIIKVNCNNNDQYLSRQNSAITSFSNVSVKREREIVSEEAETTTERVSSTRVVSDNEDEDSPNARKKLRLTKAQSALLEESFKKHSTLNPKQKQELAKELNLRARQVEVWFQNRRARTKLKQTEVDCEFLKKCCDTLTDENRRLHKELQELKALKLGSSQPFYMQMPAATLTMCPACERIGGGINPHGETTTSSSKTGLISIAPKPHFFNPFTKSAAC